jgi:hypothetical protein
MAYCSHCAAVLDPSLAMCARCGRPTQPAIAAEPPSSVRVAILLLLVSWGIPLLMLARAMVLYGPRIGIMAQSIAGAVLWLVLVAFLVAASRLGALWSSDTSGLDCRKPGPERLAHWRGKPLGLGSSRSSGRNAYLRGVPFIPPRKPCLVLARLLWGGQFWRQPASGRLLRPFKKAD